MASTIHHGPFVTISEAYQSLMQWIEANGYRIAGPCREVYLQTAHAHAGSQTDPNTVTEIQFPVEKA
jgi:effector-binding domain-containing protein